MSTPSIYHTHTPTTGYGVDNQELIVQANPETRDFKMEFSISNNNDTPINVNDLMLFFYEAKKAANAVIADYYKKQSERPLSERMNGEQEQKHTIFTHHCSLEKSNSDDFDNPTLSVSTNYNGQCVIQVTGCCLITVKDVKYFFAEVTKKINTIVCLDKLQISHVELQKITDTLFKINSSDKLFEYEKQNFPDIFKYLKSCENLNDENHNKADITSNLTDISYHIAYTLTNLDSHEKRKFDSLIKSFKETTADKHNEPQAGMGL